MSERRYVVTPRPDGDVLVIELPEDFTSLEKEAAMVMVDRIKVQAHDAPGQPIVVVVPSQIRLYYASGVELEEQAVEGMERSDEVSRCDG